MPPLEVRHERLRRQRISGEKPANPATLVSWMGAVQAQDYGSAKWAVGLRTDRCTDDRVEEALTNGEILRTHILRPTWHFVAPEDIRWMQMLTAPRVQALMAYHYRLSGLSPAMLRRADTVIAKALEGGHERTKAEIGAALAKARIPTAGLALGNILMHAELEALICSGGRRGKQFTYALLEERAPQAAKLYREEALARLTERYFASHGPATLRDLAWWSGLSMQDIKAGVGQVGSKLTSETIGEREYWMSESAPAVKGRRGSVHLLPIYDEYVVGYTDRRDVFEDVHTQGLDARHNPLYQNIIVSGGMIAGNWKRTLSRRGISIEAKFFEEPTKAEVRALGLAAKRLSAFMGAPIADFSL
ncbi:MAG TPA: winged helix DNA-binding domain-containing protein [Anaerolineales bacterium]|nr:winged helix DNA-binding domain-containing protein [Anaerolineales bacterium]